MLEIVVVGLVTRGAKCWGERNEAECGRFRLSVADWDFRHSTDGAQVAGLASNESGSQLQLEASVFGNEIFRSWQFGKLRVVSCFDELEVFEDYLAPHRIDQTNPFEGTSRLLDPLGRSR